MLEKIFTRWGPDVVSDFDWQPVDEIITSHYSASSITVLRNLGIPTELIKVAIHLEPNPERLNPINGLSPLGVVEHEHGLLLQNPQSEDIRVFLPDGEQCFRRLDELEIFEMTEIWLNNTETYWDQSLV